MPHPRMQLFYNLAIRSIHLLIHQFSEPDFVEPLHARPRAASRMVHRTHIDCAPGDGTFFCETWAVRPECREGGWRSAGAGTVGLLSRGRVIPECVPEPWTPALVLYQQVSRPLASMTGSSQHALCMCACIRLLPALRGEGRLRTLDRPL